MPFLGQRHDARPRVEIEERRQHGRTAHPVEDGVMHLGHQRRPLPLEALDHVHLPQGTVGVELPAHHRGDERIQLRPPAGRGQAGPAQVVVEFEIGVVDPDRVVEPERDPDGPLAERRHQVQALLDHPPDLRVARRGREQRAPPLGRVEHQRHAHVHGCRRRLERQERGIHADQGPHHHLFLPVRAVHVICDRRFPILRSSHPQVPECPKPPVPRSELPRPSTVTISKATWSARRITSWAMRSPRCTA